MEVIRDNSKRLDFLEVSGINVEYVLLDRCHVTIEEESDLVHKCGLNEY